MKSGNEETKELAPPPCVGTSLDNDTRAGVSVVKEVVDRTEQTTTMKLWQKTFRPTSQNFVDDDVRIFTSDESFKNNTVAM